MESAKIIGLCVLVGVIYGIVHDQITARICLEYFTVFHPDVFHTQSPTLLALGWGVLATWWVSVTLGVLLAIASRAGSRPKLASLELIPLLVKLLTVMAFCALSAGLAGYFLKGLGMEYYNTSIPKAMMGRFYADLWAHNMSYFSGFVGGLVLCLVVWRRRGRFLNERILSRP